VLYRFLADVVVVVHFGFIVFVAIGGVMAWRWPTILWLHVPTVLWGLGIITVGYECPLTPLEKELRQRGGEEGYRSGFVDRYLEDVVYPDDYTPHLRAVAAVLILLGWIGVVIRSQRSTRRTPSPSRHSEPH
jgi:hypothetical protein